MKNAVKYLNRFTDYEKTTGYSYNAAYFNLARMRYLLFKLGDPHFKVPSIHITGTKGKGSVASMLSSMLTEAGLKTGLYTSPHILTFRERIKINGKMISREFVVDFVERTKKVSEQIRPSFFELTVALAFDYFEKIDFA